MGWGRLNEIDRLSSEQGWGPADEQLQKQQHRGGRHRSAVANPQRAGPAMARSPVGQSPSGYRPIPPTRFANAVDRLAYLCLLDEQEQETASRPRLA